MSSLDFLTISGLYASLLRIVYQDVLGLARGIRSALLVDVVWNAINDPILGDLSDHTYSRLEWQEGASFGVSALATQQVQSLVNFLTAWTLNICGYFNRDHNLVREKAIRAQQQTSTNYR